MAAHWPILFAFVPLGFAVRAWFEPGLIAGEDLRTPMIFSVDMLRDLFPWPQMWDPTFSLGVSRQLWSINYPVWALAGILARLGAGWPLIERMLWLWPFVLLSVFSPYALAYRITRSSYASAIAAVVFSLNPFTIALIERGHIPSLVSYSLLPVLTLVTRTALARPSTRGALLAALIFTTQIAYDMRYAYMGAIVIAAYLVASLIARRPPRGLVAMGALFVVAVCVLNLYWLLPAVLSPAFLPPGYGSTDSFISASRPLDLLHAMSGFYPYYHHRVGTDPFLRDAVEWPFLVLPVGAIVGLAFTRLRRDAAAFGMMWLLAALIGSGPASSFAGIDLWIFAHVPGMTLFRDVGKFFGLSEFAGAILLACALAYCIHRLSAKAGLHRASAVIFLMFGIFWVYAMRDAYNPIRFSNFAKTEFSPSDQALQRFFADPAHAGRVLYFPDMPQGIGPTKRNPVVSSGFFSASFQFGFGVLDPSIDNFYAFLRSPLARDLLCQTQMKYFVVPEDDRRDIYRPFSLPLDHEEVLSYMRSRPYLRELRITGEHKVFSVVGCPSAPPAFIAPTPVAFDGAVPSMAAIADTEFWTSRAAVVMAEQQSGDVIFHRLSNTVSGVMLLSPTDRIYQYPLRRMQDSLRSIAVVAKHETKPFDGVALSRAAMSLDFREENAWDYIAGRFSNDRPWRATVLAVASPRRDLHGSVFTKRFRHDSDVRMLRSPFQDLLIDPFAFTARIAGVPSAVDEETALWHGVDGSGVMVEIYNPLPVAARANIRIPGIAARHAAFLTLRARINDSTTTIPIFGNVSLGSLRFARSVQLQDILLYPGVNQLTLSAIGVAASSRDIAFELSPAITISKTTPLSAVATASVRPSLQFGDALGIESAADEPDERYIDRVRLADDLRIPLLHRPTLRLNYVSPGEDVSMRAILGLRRADGRNFDFPVDLSPSGTRLTLEVYQALQKALDDTDQSEHDAHKSDWPWILSHSRTPLVEPSQFALQYVDVYLSRRRGNVMAVGRGARIGSMSIDLYHTQSAPGPRYDDVARLDFEGGDESPNIVPQGLSLTSVAKNGSELALSMLLQPSPQAVDPADIGADTQITVHQTNGSVVSGVVTSAHGDTLVVDEGGHSVGLSRSAIATYDSAYRAPRQDVDIQIPINARPDVQFISFDLGMDNLLTMQARLVVEDERTKKRYEVAPTDRLQLNNVEPVIPSEWIRTVPDEDVAPPVVVSDPVVSPASPSATPVGPHWTRYQIPLAGVYALQLPRVDRPRLVALSVRLSVPGGAAISDYRPSRAVVANVFAARWAFDSRARMRTGDLPSLTIDGTTVALSPAGTGEEERGDRVFTSQPIVIPPGVHVLKTDGPGAANIDSIVLNSGSVARSASSEMTDARRTTPSIVSGRLDTPGGVLVLPESYDHGWTIAARGYDYVEPSDPFLAYLSLRSSFLRSASHLAVNGAENGFIVPAIHGRVIFLYLPTVFGELGVIVGGTASVLLYGVLLIRGRRP